MITYNIILLNGDRITSTKPFMVNEENNDVLIDNLNIRYEIKQ